MDHSQVAIQADTAQETNANVDVLIEQEATQLTQPLPVLPVIILKQQCTWNQFSDLWITADKTEILHT